MPSVRVLVVDDDPWILRMVSSSLEKKGDFAVETARDGQQALDKVHKAPPDLIITDVMMPVMDGWTFVQNLRSNPAHAHIPVLFLTALGTDETQLRQMGISKDSCISKPFRFDELERRVIGALSGKGGGSSETSSAGQSPPSQQQGSYPPGQGYPPQQGGYPPQQGGYPPQQGGYPPQQGGYPPQQGGYPPQQGGYGYPPQQGGYPPQQGGYPPQQGYPPRPGGYPPQQGYPPGQGYPPQQGGYPPQQGYPPGQGYPPQQGGYRPQQGGYPPQQGGYPPQQGGPQSQSPIAPGGRPPSPNQLPETPAAAPSKPAASKPSKPKRKTALNGRLEQLGLSSLIVMMEMERKGGVLALNNAEDKRVGRIFIRKGMIVHAKIDKNPDLDGKSCIYEMMKWEKGRFAFSAMEVDMEDTIKASPTALLMEGARLIDEENR